MLIIPDVNATKHPKWAGAETPNTAYEHDPSYREISTAFAKKADVGGPYRWFEVRIVSEKSVLSFAESARWWNEPAWMDKIIWVYQKPRLFNVDNKSYQTYLLEFFECQRVLARTIGKFGHNIFEDEFPALLIPCDCVQIAWTETANGYSEHRRDAEVQVVTQADIDKEAKMQERVKFLQDYVHDISETPYGDDDLKGFV